MPKNFPKLAEQSDGDLEAKVKKFRQKLWDQRKEAQLLIQDTNYAGAIEAVFNEHGDVSISIPALSSMAPQKLRCTAENYHLLRDRVVTFIRNYNWLVIRAGKDGGVRSTHAGVKIGTFGATCMSRIIYPPKKTTHSPKRKTAKR